MSSFVLESLKMMPSTSSLLSLYASFSTSLLLLRNAYRELVPRKVEDFVVTKILSFFNRIKYEPSYNTFIIDDSWKGLSRNKLLEISRFYLSTKISSNNKIVKIGKFRGHKAVTAGLVKGAEISDFFEGIDIKWSYNERDPKDGGGDYFQISFESKNRDKVFNDYLSHVVKTYKDMTKEEKVLRIYSWSRGWTGMDFQHSATFDSIAMDKELKKMIVDDVDRYLTRRDYYKRIGKAWKRGYLLYGPPGTGKSSLIAAMANYLNYDVYDLDLSNVNSDSELRRAMLDVNRKSIVVIEDIDCISEVHNRSNSDCSGSDSDSDDEDSAKFSLSSLLNCVDGLWSSCSDERIIVFTTNHKEVLDPALLRPGRMDMHIHMSYCTPQGFRVLVSNYLEIKEHNLFDEIDELISTTEVTPASIAEELMKSDDPDVALLQVLNFLKSKKVDKDKNEEERNSLM